MLYITNEETCLPSVGLSSFKMDWSEAVNCCVVWAVKSWKSFRKSPCPPGERTHPAHQHTLQKSASLMGMGVAFLHMASWLTFTHLWGNHWCRMLYTGFAEKNVLPRRQCLLQGGPWLFPQDNGKPYSAHITKTRLHSRRFRMLKWLVCCPNMSPTENVWCVYKM